MDPNLTPRTELSPQPRVLVVEDDAADRALIRELLESEGISVIGEAAGGAVGVELTVQLRPDVVLMDFRMPGMDGMEATRMIKEAVPTTQVVILTVYEDAALIRSAEEVGAYAYLVKGCPAGLIRDVIHHAWAHRRAEAGQPTPH